MRKVDMKLRILRKCFTLLVIAVGALLIVGMLLQCLPTSRDLPAVQNQLGTVLVKNESSTKGPAQHAFKESANHSIAAGVKEVYGSEREKKKEEDNKPILAAKPCEQKGRRDVVHVVISGDNNTFVAMVTLATSIMVNTRSTVMVHFITFDNQAGQLRSILQSSIVQNTSYQIIPFSRDTLKGQFVVRGPREDLANPLNFVRIYLPDLLPCIDTVAYIDVDCLVLGDIKHLYNWHIKEKHVIALFPKVKSFASTVLNFSHPLVRKLSIKPSTIVPQAGVFVANLTRWRQRNITAQLDYWMKTNVKNEVVQYTGEGAGSQAIFLLVFYDNYTPLSGSWNKMVYPKNDEKSDNLLHWNGPRKPWEMNKKDVRKRDQWLDYFKTSRANLTFTCLEPSSAVPPGSALSIVWWLWSLVDGSSPMCSWKPSGR